MQERLQNMIVTIHADNEKEFELLLGKLRQLPYDLEYMNPKDLEIGYSIKTFGFHHLSPKVLKNALLNRRFSTTNDESLSKEWVLDVSLLEDLEELRSQFLRKNLFEINYEIRDSREIHVYVLRLMDIRKRSTNAYRLAEEIVHYSLTHLGHVRTSFIPKKVRYDLISSEGNHMSWKFQSNGIKLVVPEKVLLRFKDLFGLSTSIVELEEYYCTYGEDCYRNLLNWLQYERLGPIPCKEAFLEELFHTTGKETSDSKMVFLIRAIEALQLNYVNLCNLTKRPSSTSLKLYNPLKPNCQYYTTFKDIIGEHSEVPVRGYTFSEGVTIWDKTKKSDAVKKFLKGFLSMTYGPWLKKSEVSDLKESSSYHCSMIESNKLQIKLYENKTSFMIKIHVRN